jgi:hypothetical protein
MSVWPLVPLVMWLSAAPAGPGSLPTLEVAMPPAARTASAALALRVAFRQDTLSLRVEVKDDHPLPADRLDLSLAFRDAGLTARGVVFGLGRSGLLAPPEVGGAEPWAQTLVKAVATATPGGYAVELAIPARALPRFPAFAPLRLEVCLEYTDVDEAGGPERRVQSCPGGAAPSGPIRLPDGWRRSLALTPDVEGVEGRPHGWIGISRRHEVVWAQGDAALTPVSLAELLGEDPAESDPAGLRIDPVLTLPRDRRQLFSVLSGRAPFKPGGGCTEGAELRLGLYLVKGAAASRALSWPVASCLLGRANRLELGEDDSLSLGYTTGATAHFTWTQGRFERSELGQAAPRRP